MAGLVEPRTLRGFRDYLPALMIPREQIMESARRVFRSYGFAPIETPALEYADVLLAKVDEGAEINKQVYRFRDQGDRDVALRFDLTVPLARFVSQHANDLGLPFKRYHLGPVWRGESPQVGRYREFVQCDFDIIGSTSSGADTEIALVVCDLLTAIGLERFTVHINHRAVLNGLLAELGLADRVTPVLRALDKLSKIGAAAVTDELTRETGATPQQAAAVVALAETRGDNGDVLDELAARFSENDDALGGVKALRRICEVAELAGIRPGSIEVDLSICRGLDYYTGTVYETFLDDLPAIGSVCSGGRYDDLTGRYTRQSLPGVGASLGLDRLLAALDQLGSLPSSTTTAPVLVVQFDAARLGDYQRIARVLRAVGVGVEVYPDAKKVGAQLQYAERKGFAIALIAGGDEFATGSWKVKHLAARTEQAVAEADLIDVIRGLLP